MSTASSDPLRLLAAYYLAGGVWPIVHLRSFMALTGPKTDTWLVRTFGAFIAALGIGLWPARTSDRPAQERTAVLGALSLAVCDAVFVANRRISPIYLADAAAELILASAIVARRMPATDLRVLRRAGALQRRRKRKRSADLADHKSGGPIG